MPDLSPHLHTDECNLLIKQLQDCYSKSTFGKWFGNCDTFQVSVDKCLKSERQANRDKNLEASRKRKDDIQQRMNNSGQSGQ